MKNSIVTCMVALSLVAGVSLCQENSGSQVTPQHSYEVLLVVLEQGYIKIERYPMEAERCSKQIIFSLDLSDNNEVYNTILCNSQTNGFILIRSNNEAMCDYCLNWGAMVGVDDVDTQVAAFVPATIKTNEQGGKSLVMSGMVEGKNFDLEVAIEQPVKDACALVVPTELVEKMTPSSQMMSFAEGCRLGIVVARKRNESIVDSSLEREIEFERIINAMVQDGTIKVKPVSPFMAKLRTVGSTLFVHYLAVKKFMRSWWNSLWHASDNNHKIHTPCEPHKAC